MNTLALTAPRTGAAVPALLRRLARMLAVMLALPFGTFGAFLTIAGNPILSNPNGRRLHIATIAYRDGALIWTDL